MDSSIKLLKDMTMVEGVSGFEDEAVETAKKYLSDSLIITKDSMLNLYIDRANNDKSMPTVMFDAHMDEVGFITHSIKANGLIKVIAVGGFAAHNLPAHRVKIRNGQGKYISGIITSSPVHYKEKNDNISLDNIFVDIGACSYDEVREHFNIGMAMPVIFDSTFEYDEKSDIIKSKAFDCRAGCSCVIETMNELEGESLKVNLMATLTSQEEVGTRGAIVAANKIKPDIAIVMEGTPADDTFAEAYQIQTKIKKGPMLRHMDPRMIANPRFQKFALGIAKKYDIPCQEAVRTGGGTNGFAIHTSNAAVPTIVIGVPVRYPHTSNCIMSYSDYKNMKKLAIAIIRELNFDIIKSF